MTDWGNKEEVKEYNKKWRANNQERIKKAQKKYYESPHGLKAREEYFKTQYYPANREKLLQKHKDWRKKNIELARAAFRKWQLRSVYGISLEEYNSMFLAQGRGCAICGNLNRNGRQLHVDHCHKSKKIRGLLCGKCNTGLGQFQDNQELLIKAARYLNEAASLLVSKS